MKEIDETNIKSDEIKETSGGVEKQKRVREFVKSAAVVVALVRQRLSSVVTSRCWETALHSLYWTEFR